MQNIYIQYFMVHFVIKYIFEYDSHPVKYWLFGIIGRVPEYQ